MLALKIIWKWIAANKEQIKIFFALVTAAYVLFEYQANIASERVKRTLDFESRYSQGEILSARVDLASFWR